MPIPVRNLYYLLCYAWRRLPEGGIGEHGQDPGKDLADLFARFLSHGFLTQVRRGLDRVYVDVVEESSALRGKGLWIQTAQAQSLDRGRIVCEYQELSLDTQPNRLLKAGFRLLERHVDLDPELRKRVRLCLTFLKDVPAVPLSEGAFRSIQNHGGLRGYAWLLDACRLLARWSIMDEGDSLAFRDVFRDEREMSRLFEQFVQGFYRMNECGYQIESRTLKWPLRPQNEEASALLPGMQTDITMTRGDETLVIDTKYYAHTLTSASDYNKESLYSGNLYQMHAYLSTLAAQGAKLLTGILLYPRVDRDIHVEYKHDDYCLKAHTLDLGAPWQSIHDSLVGMI